MSTNSDEKIIDIRAEIKIEAAGEGAAEKQGPRRFEVLAYTGGELHLSNFDLPVVVDLAGAQFTKSLIANLDHRGELRVGHVTEKSKEGGQLKFSGLASAATPARDEVIASADSGFPFEASIEAKPEKLVLLAAGKTATVNGQTFTGPIYIARKSTIRGFAFVSHGADITGTQVTIAATAAKTRKGKDMKFEQWLEAKGFGDMELSEAQTATMQAMFDAEKKAKETGDTDPDLDEIFASQKQREERRKAITKITADALAENPHLTAQIEAMARNALAGDVNVRDFELKLLKACRPSLGDLRPGSSSREAQYNGQVIEAALCKTGMLPGFDKAFEARVLDEADKQFPRGIGLKQMMVLAAQANGYHGYNGGPIDLELQRAAFGQGPYSIRASGGFSTLNISTIISNTANKFRRDGWMSVDQTPLRIAAQRPTNDLKELTTVSLIGGAMFEKINAAGEIQHGTLGEVTYGNKADLFGLMLAITLEHYLNDDVGALTTAPKRLGRAAMLKIADLFFTAFMDNSTFFTTGRGNLDEGADTALALSSLELADQLFMAQTDPDGNPLGAEPAILFVPSALKNTALTLMSSSTVVGGSSVSPDKNVFAGRYRVEHSSYLGNTNYTGNSNKKWYLLADPNVLPVIELVALNGQIEPKIDTADADFNVLGTQMRGYYGVGVRKQEYRGGVAMKGEN